MLKEYEVVRLLTDFPKVPAGAIGTVLGVLQGESEYLVEFLNSTGETLDILSIKESDVIKVEY